MINSLYSKDIIMPAVWTKLRNYLIGCTYFTDSAHLTIPSQPTHTLYTTLILLHITPLRCRQMTSVQSYFWTSELSITNIYTCLFLRNALYDYFKRALFCLFVLHTWRLTCLQRHHKTILRSLSSTLQILILRNNLISHSQTQSQ